MKLALTLVALAALAASPVRAAMLTTDPHTYPVTANHRIRLEFPVGQLKVIPADGNTVSFDIKVRCRRESDERCEELANQLILDSDDSAGTSRLSHH